MILAESLIAEFRRESASTRKFLERFPEDRADFKPHDKSMGLAQLVCHIIEMPDWGANIVRDSGFDFAAWEYKPLGLRTREALLAKHDEITERMVGVLAELTGESAAETWTLRNGEQVIEALPRGAALRSFVFSHMVHHRGQLSVYYRLLAVPVPGAYGPSADDPRPE